MSEELECKMMDVLVNEDTGESSVIGSINTDELQNELNSTIADAINSDEVEEIEDINEEIYEDEMKEYVDSNDSFINEFSDDQISLESTRALLEIINRRNKNKNEKINYYKEMPEELQIMIDNYLKENGLTVMGNSIATINQIRNNVAESIIDQCNNDIQIKKIKNDFAEEINNLYSDIGVDIAESSLEYFNERNEAYREAAEKIEDEDKKNRLLSIIDQMDTAKDLVELKEFAKRCKIKSIELEKPYNKVYSSFVNKYKNSSNNIYNIDTVKKSIMKNLPEYSEKEIDAFLICFCKQVRNYKVDDIMDHIYMYYVLYYANLMEGDKSNTFKNNVIEVINNLKAHNNILNK